MRYAQTLCPLAASSRVELSPQDGEWLGVATGDEVTVRTEAGEVQARAALRDSLPPGTAFLLDDGTTTSPAAAGAQFVEVIAK